MAMADQQKLAARRLAEAVAAGIPHRDRVSPGDWPIGARWCSGCQTFVPLWYASGSRCRACASAARQAAHREATYGLDPAGFAALEKTQGGTCAICRKRQRDRAIAVDHHHGTGDVRGLLCKRCNHDLLGAGFDSARMLLAGLTYLLAPPASGNWLEPERYGDRVLRAVLLEMETIVLERAEQAGNAATGR
jgi:hypothetical protein